MRNSFPKIYPILDSSYIPAIGRAEFLRRLAGSLAEAGVTLLEYRNKAGLEDELKTDAAVLRAALPAGQVKLILDDRVDLVESLGFDGVHVDAGDVTPTEARRLLGPERLIGTFGGGDALLADILRAPVDYLSIGPVFHHQDQADNEACDWPGWCAQIACGGWARAGAGWGRRNYTCHRCCSAGCRSGCGGCLRGIVSPS